MHDKESRERQRGVLIKRHIVKEMTAGGFMMEEYKTPQRPGNPETTPPPIGSLAFRGPFIDWCHGSGSPWAGGGRFPGSSPEPLGWSHL